MLNLKYANVALPGDRLRSYDFRGRTDCYIEGVVETIRAGGGFAAFLVRVDVDGWNGKEARTGGRVGQQVAVPMEMIGDYDGRVVKL